jgi:phenylalanyl-tRNA synthetase beta chain
MKISLNWLSDYVDIPVDVEALTEALTMAGVEVEHIEKNGEDTVVTVEITPNRPDCLSYLGIAREVAAIMMFPRKNPVIPNNVYSVPDVSISNEAPQDCSRYIGTMVKNVSVKPAPIKMQIKLAGAGLRSINNIVDITNFSLLENGQPLHAFDLDKLQGGKIVIRRAKSGEKIVTIDGVERELDPSILVIADAVRPVAIAGIMGGKDTEVTDNTKNILLESAYFDPILIRRASRKLGLSSDSSYRFERGVNFETVEGGVKRALSLIAEMAGGEVAGRTDLITEDKRFVPPEINTTVEAINEYLGAELSAAECRDALMALDFTVAAKGNALKIKPPHFRADINSFVDIVEEVARIIGYNRLPGSLPRISMINVRADEYLKNRKQIKQKAIAQGLNEIISYSLISKKALELTKLPESNAVKVCNPLSQEQEMMRPSLLPGMLSVVQTNFNRGQRDLAFFEIGKKYSSEGETELLAIILSGKRSADWRQTSKERYDLFDLKGMIETVAGDKLKLHYSEIENDCFETGQAASISVDQSDIGIMGRINDDILAAWDIKTKDLLFAQLDLNALLSLPEAQIKYQPLTEYPAVVRDISLALDKNIKYRQIHDFAFKNGAGLLQKVSLLEEYCGEKIENGQRGLVISLTYQSKQRTLREEEVNSVHNSIVDGIINELGASRR